MWPPRARPAGRRSSRAAGTPGTTVEEHKLWALVLSSHLAPSSLLLCAVNATSGGGDTPIAPAGVTASGDPCPNGGALPTGSALPSWYVATGLTQGPNVIAANACNFPNGNSSCYVLTDRGTYDYLASGTDPAGSIPGLKIVSRDNDAAAPGGANELINYFHAYVINPAKAGETVNLTAAQDWANFLTVARHPEADRRLSEPHQRPRWRAVYARRRTAAHGQGAAQDLPRGPARDPDRHARPTPSRAIRR